MSVLVGALDFRNRAWITHAIYFLQEHDPLHEHLSFPEHEHLPPSEQQPLLDPPQQLPFESILPSSSASLAWRCSLVLLFARLLC
eukprot:CAMPEP_0171459202 /NCGR_PEP_ID=MMETSP0945-20130129/4581_1 /TAXON_ID=109269 /ORGANISM="Vaucheria litorea, Strain CCMP2940" /LENGTH=84 /DNA_ID=CAMNT_0011985175 /DNA_START=22 /DNA_END=273 /DNA_ORIENTATION=-